MYGSLYRRELNATLARESARLWDEPEANGGVQGCAPAPAEANKANAKAKRDGARATRSK